MKFSDTKKLQRASYEPISFLSNMSKIMGGILLNRIKEKEKELGIIPDEQGEALHRGPGHEDGRTRDNKY